MVDVNEDVIKNLSRLARIEIKEEEIPAFLKTLKDIIAYFDQLQEVDVSDLSPYSHVEEQGVGSLRDDVAENSLTHDRFMANAPDHIGGMIRVPPVIKQQQ